METKGGTPTRTGQRVVNNNMRSAGGRRGGGGRGEEGRRASAEGAPDASDESEHTEQWGGGGGIPPTPPTQQGCVRARGGLGPSTEEGTGLQFFTPARSHLPLRGIYGYFLHHNDGTHLSVGVPDDTMWRSRWRRLAAQSASWYSTPPGKLGHRFTAVLAAYWRGVLGWKWNSERLLVFDHVILTKTLGACKAREIQEIIDRRLDLWERGSHAGLVRDALTEGRAQEVRVERRVEE